MYAARIAIVVALAGFAIPLAQSQGQQDRLVQASNQAPGDAFGVVQAMSDALGEFRHSDTHPRVVKGISFIANGTMADLQAKEPWPQYKVSKLTTEITYYTFTQGVVKSPGVRWDFTLINPQRQTERRILAAAGDSAWDEATPGGTVSPTTDTATNRLQQIWWTPHGLLWAALTSNEKSLVKGVSVADEGGKKVLTIPIEGLPAKVTLGADNRPEKVESRIKHPLLGEIGVEINYSGYRDFEHYSVFFPTHIVEKFGGHTVLDLTVTEFHTNPYIVFPVPSNIQQAAK
jgi:hypothetical protein